MRPRVIFYYQHGQLAVDLGLGLRVGHAVKEAAANARASGPACAVTRGVAAAAPAVFVVLDHECWHLYSLLGRRRDLCDYRDLPPMDLGFFELFD